jgi:2,4-dienoyl-CoA reductase-like NADH-dependent reductase (Old Yellow Enzyme family)
MILSDLFLDPSVDFTAGCGKQSEPCAGISEKQTLQLTVQYLFHPNTGRDHRITFESKALSERFFYLSTTLFSPFTLNGLTLPNRIVMAPMTRNFSPGGVPGQDVAAYYGRRAEGGVGLILTEGTSPEHPQAANMPQIPHLYGAQAMAGWMRVVEGVHAAGGRIFSQIWHVGAVQNPGEGPKLPASPISPSGLLKPGVKIGEPMSLAEIEGMVDAYAHAAENAQRAGFDGIELHGAHGYLIDQFFWQGSNQRTDKYGGHLVARTRFAVEVIQECRRRTGPRFPIQLRFSQWKLQDYGARLATTPDELERFLSPLAEAGLDAFHCSTRRFWDPEFQGSDMNLAGWTKKLTGKPTITVGSVSLDVDFMVSLGRTPRPESGTPQSDPNSRAAEMDHLAEMLARGDFDLVAVGRAMLADSSWAAKVRDGHFGDLQSFSPEVLKTLT